MKNKGLKYIRNTLFLALVILVKVVVFFIPLKLGRWIFAEIAVLGFYLLPGERKKIYRNLDIVFDGKKTKKEKRQFGRKNFRNYGISVFEFLKFSMWKPEKIAKFVKVHEGLEYFKENQDKGRGVIAVTAHMSNWEIQSIFLAYQGLNIGAIAKQIFDKRIDKIVNATRRKNGVKIFDKSGISVKMIKGLKKGMVLGILVDQDTSVDSVYVPFLGKSAKTPIAPAVFAKKFDLALLTAYAYRRDDGYYCFKANKPIDIAGLSNEEIAEKYNKELSDAIMEHPEQWVWLHRRYKTIEEKQTEEAGIKS